MMRIPSNGMSAATPAAPVAPAEAVSPAASPTAAAARSAGGSPPLQSAVLGPAMAALDQMPEIDAARVAELRDAFARGELPFDAAKLAGLIERFHGGRA